MNTFDIQIREDYLVNARHATLDEVQESLRLLMVQRGLHETAVVEVPPCDHSDLETQIVNLTAQVDSWRQSYSRQAQLQKEILSAVHDYLEENEEYSGKFVDKMIDFGMDPFTRDRSGSVTVTVTLTYEVSGVPINVDDSELEEAIGEEAERAINIGLRRQSVTLGDDECEVEFSEHDFSVDDVVLDD